MLENLEVIQQFPLRLTTNKCYQIWIRVKKLLKIEFDSKPVYGDNDKYIKKNMLIVWLQTFRAKKCQKKKHHVSVYQ